MNLLVPVLLAGALVLPGAPAVARAVPPCEAHVCLWPGANYTGTPFKWWEANGNVFVGGRLADNVGSFAANLGACFVDTADSEWSWHSSRRASTGDYSSSYYNRYGNVMDRIAPARYC